MTTTCDCGVNIREHLIEVISYCGAMTTPIIGIQDIVDDELLLEYAYDDEERYDKYTELEGYECGNCGKTYTKEQLLNIFNEDVTRINIVHNEKEGVYAT